MIFSTGECHPQIKAKINKQAKFCLQTYGVPPIILKKETKNLKMILNSKVTPNKI